MEIENHRLLGARQVPALAIGGAIEPWLVVVHYTANQAAAGVVSWFQSPQSKVSAHLVVDLDGAITQMVPFNLRASHAGPSRWRGSEGCNGFSIGVEIVNPGPLKRRGDNTWVDQLGKTWAGKVLDARHKNGNAEHQHWAEYPEVQFASVREACEALAKAYPIREIVGHDDVAPTRKMDPGPAFPLETLRSILVGRDQDGADTYAATTTVNVRSAPGVQNPTVEGSPFAPGQRVQVIEVHGGWWHVRTPDATVEGWVSSHFFRSV